MSTPDTPGSPGSPDLSATPAAPRAPAGPLAAAVGSWTLDPSASTVELRTKAMWGLVPVKAAFRAVEGGGTVAPDGSLTGTLTVDAASVDTGNKKRDTHLRSADFFEVDTHPTFTYTASGASAAAGDRITVAGTLEIRGQARPLDIGVKLLEHDAHSAVLGAEVDLDRAAWGITWAKMGAKLHNHITLQLRFTRS